MDQTTEQPMVRMPRAYEAVVVVVGGLVGAFFGFWANLLYVLAMNDAPAFVGHWVGGSSGLAAGLLWVRSMRPRFESGLRRGRLIGWGAMLGMAVGAGSALLLHLGLQAYLGRWDGFGFLVGLAFGVPAGAIVGALCALVGAALLNRARRKAAEAPAVDPGA